MMWDEYVPDEGMVKEIQKAGEHLAELKNQLEDATVALSNAQKAYDEFAREELPLLFRGHGIEELKLSDGKTLKIKTITKCSLVKNKEGRDSVMSWLKDNGGSQLISSEITVPGGYGEQLKNAGIPYDESETVNTNSLKSFLLDVLGQKGSPAQIHINDIPKGCGFYQYEEADII